jgi:hypothetical protein
VNGELRECSKLLTPVDLQMAENSIQFKKVQIIEEDEEEEEAQKTLADFSTEVEVV